MEQPHNSGSDPTEFWANVSYMEDKAANWKQCYSNEIRNGNTPFADWPAFKDAFKLSFQPIDDLSTAMKELRTLSQGSGSAAAYQDKFDRVVMRTGMSDVDRRMRFYEGLSSEVKNALVYSQVDTTLYADLAKEAIKLDNRIEERKAEEKAKKAITDVSTSACLNPFYTIAVTFTP